MRNIIALSSHSSVPIGLFPIARFCFVDSFYYVAIYKVIVTTSATANAASMFNNGGVHIYMSGAIQAALYSPHIVFSGYVAVGS
ncbi:hypothetical protein BJ742DRAFT_352551 [Cladochytrium replicatum]|nr:hypothetical protein BJ742DRAFT_352551 [Cladochytrium replicatum]